MNKPTLTLRQRKILYHIMNQKTFITGKDLARELNVTDRTVRSDIQAVNHYIHPYNAEIISVKSKGYLFEAEDEEKINELNRTQLGLLTKEDRVHYLAFRLCLADEAVHMYDLEEEMYTSHTTLEQDIKLMQKMFVLSPPFIKLHQNNNELAFERDEKKIRVILTRLVHDDWDYYKRGNAFYSYHFLNEEILNHIIDHVPLCLQQHNIGMDDPSLIYLDIMLAVAYQRYSAGYTLPDASPYSADHLSDSQNECYLACQDIFSMLEELSGYAFPYSEKKAVFEQIITSHLADMSMINIDTIHGYLEKTVTDTADLYLNRIKNIFGLNLSGDDDFYVTLCMTISNFRNDAYIYHAQGNHSRQIDQMTDEFEMAMLFQSIAKEHLGRLLTEIELINLAYCISGAMLFLFRSHPELKLRTVLSTHRNMIYLWYLKRKILSEYGAFLEITDLLPANAYSGYDFSSTDLLMTTDNKQFLHDQDVETLHINSTLSEADSAEISSYISRKKYERLCPVMSETPGQLLEEGIWREKENRKSINEIIRIMTEDFDDGEGFKEKLYKDILLREKISSFAIGRSIVFMHSFIPSKKTGLSIMTLDHRLMWNNYKIRIIILGVFKEEYMPMLLRLKHLFYDKDREAMRMLKTKEEVCSFFLDQ